MTLNREAAPESATSAERAEALTMTSEQWMGALAHAWERGYMFGFAQERGRDTHSEPVPDYLTEDVAEWNPYRVTPPAATEREAGR